ncbi:L-histidine N(alpha)-methyltransferase [Acidihalobacter prosperus]
MSVGREAIGCRRIRPERRVNTLMEDARVGLLEPPRRLPPKYFYDARGSALFDRICDTEEYYPTRTENALLARHAGEIMGHIRPRHILELGSGTSRKTRHLLRAREARECGTVYWPFDVCREVLEETGESLVEEFPWLEVNPLLGDYSAGLAHLPRPADGCLYAFLGGTLGNFEEPEALKLLSELAFRMSPADRLLLGVDRVKPTSVLQAAYDDSQGVTAAFNRNLLHVLNRELEADFEPEAFAHRSLYNEAAARIEMYLVAEAPQQVRVGRLEATLRFDAGETILTEISRKFTEASVTRLLARAGLAIERHYAPDNQYFSLLTAVPQPDVHDPVI